MKDDIEILRYWDVFIAANVLISQYTNIFSHGFSYRNLTIAFFCSVDVMLT